MACVIGPKRAEVGEGVSPIVRERTERRCRLMSGGRLDHSLLDELWCAATIEGFAEANANLCPYLLATMHAFELAYPILNKDGEPSGESLVPSMLPQQRPLELLPFAGLADDAKMAKMEVRLSFIPQELFPRLLVRLQQYVQARDCWFDAHSLSSAGMVLTQGEGADAGRTTVTLGGHFNSTGAWEATAAYATSIVIDARGPHPTMLRGLAWRCLQTLQTEYEGVDATVSLLS